VIGNRALFAVSLIAAALFLTPFGRSPLEITVADFWRILSPAAGPDEPRDVGLATLFFGGVA
jgi:hypothetical protein